MLFLVISVSEEVYLMNCEERKEDRKEGRKEGIKEGIKEGRNKTCYSQKNSF